MKKFFIALVLLLFLIFVVLAVARNFLVKTILTKGIYKNTGLDFKVGSFKLGIFLNPILIKDLKILSSSDFSNALLADIPEVYVDCNLAALIKNKVHLRELMLNIKELAIIQDKRMQLNINSLALLLPPPKGAQPPEIKIDRLKVKIGKVSYKNLFLGKGLTSVEFNPNIDEEFKGINNPNDFSRELIKRILARIGITDLVSFGKESLGEIKAQGQKIVDELSVDVNSTIRDLQKDIQDTIEEKKKDLNSLFNSGRE